MTPERHERARELFLGACELPRQRRDSFLARHCGNDEELRREIESLLAYHDGDAPVPVPDTVSNPGSNPASDPSEGGGESIGRFRVLGRLGAGGMGEVFLAEDPRLGRRVALKALPLARAADTEARRRLESEARALAALNHPHVAALYALEEIDAQLYLVIEHVEGETLAAQLRRGPLQIARTVEIGIQVAAGLEAAHTAGVIHRDLKPLNVMITPAGDAKVLDFGLAKRTRITASAEMEDPGSGASITADPRASTLPGVIVGTPAYLSPEQARGARLDPSADIWAFGCLLYECLTGTQAFEGATFSDTLARILEGEPDWSRLPPDLPPVLDRLLRRCLSKDRRRRIQHPGDVRIELEDLRDELASPRVDRDGAGPRRATAAATRAIWAVLLLLAALAGWAVAHWLGSDETRPEGPARSLSVHLPAEHPLALDESNPLGIARNALALSPDARTLVWVARTEAEGVATSRLVRRRLDRFDVEPLAGTEGAFGPFFSADGRWIGFFTGGHLRKVPAGGGSASTVTIARNPYGAAWTADDTIYFVEAEGAELVSVAADGSGRRVLPRDDRVFWPQALPDGTLLLSDPVAVFDPRTGAARPVLEAWFARYVGSGDSDSGHLLYQQHESHLLLVPFDLASGSIGEPAVPVLGDARGAVSDSVQLAVAGSTVAYLPGPQVIPRRLVWSGATVEPALEAADAYRAVALSPDGGRLAVEIPAPGPDIWVFDLDRGTSVRLTEDGASSQPIWSPDGTEVYSCRTEGAEQGSYARRADGAGPIRRPLGDVPGCPVALSPDGRWLVIMRTGTEGGWDLLAADLSSGGDSELIPVAATDAFEWGGRFSPDGRWFAYASDASGRYEVYVRSFPEETGTWLASTGGGEEPTWTADGGALLYRNGHQFLRVPFAPPARADGTEPILGRPELLVEGEFMNVGGYSYDVSHRDGRLLLLRAEAGEPPGEIRIVENWLPED